MDTTEVRLLTRKDVTRLMKISLGTLEQHIKDGVLPKFRSVRNGRLLLEHGKQESTHWATRS
jgi:hypothetical protein